MTSAWGQSWGQAWGSSWDSISPPVTIGGGTSGYRIKRGSSARPLLFDLGEEGLEPVVSVRKNGGGFIDAVGAVTEIGHGWYALAGGADNDTLGPLVLYASDPSGAVSSPVFEVVDYDPEIDQVAVLLQTLGAARVSVASPVAASGDVEAVRGDDYMAADGRAWEWTVPTALNFTGATAQFLSAKLTKTVTVIAGTGSVTLRCEPSRTDTAGLDLGNNPFSVRVTLGDGDRATLVSGVIAARDPF